MGSPPGPLVAYGVGWDKGHGLDMGKRKWGCVALRDLGSKFGSPLNSGLFGIHLQGQGWGQPYGR